MEKDKNYSFAIAGAVVGAKALAGTAVGGKIVASGIAGKAAAMGVGAKILAGAKTAGSAIGTALSPKAGGVNAIYTYTSIAGGAEGALSMRSRIKRKAKERQRRTEILNRINMYNRRLSGRDLSNRTKKALEKYRKADQELLDRSYSLKDIAEKSQLYRIISGKKRQERVERLKQDKESIVKRIAIKERILTFLDKHVKDKDNSLEAINLTVNEIRELEEKLEK